MRATFDLSGLSDRALAMLDSLSFAEGCPTRFYRDFAKSVRREQRRRQKPGLFIWGAPVLRVPRLGAQEALAVSVAFATTAEFISRELAPQIGRDYEEADKAEQISAAHQTANFLRNVAAELSA